MRLQSQQKRLDDFVKQMHLVQDLEIQSHLSRYFCILVSGYIENFVKELINKFHEGTCKKETLNFVAEKIRGLTNLSDDKLRDALKLFSLEWSERYLANRSEEMASALDTVYAQRNAIAHGKSSNSNISPATISKYYLQIKDLLLVLSMIIKKGH